ncbi:hypothetical protein CHARACLAT_022117 [Characodon lateralis]|uniref:Uncharacterized protein n=1 Tax=Characodon lateralis TaxID=208331 RepID=A0ABU7DVC8_9TELE|nr:hypothetical protein [Characodon lateralis]
MLVKIDKPFGAALKGNNYSYSWGSMNSFQWNLRFLCIVGLTSLWAIMVGQSRDSTSVFSAPEVGWSVMIQYSVCSSLIHSASTLSQSKVFHFLIVYLWQQKQPTFGST